MDIEIFMVASLAEGFDQYQLFEEPGAHILKVKTGKIVKTNIIEKSINTLLIEKRYLAAIKKKFQGIRFDVVLYPTPPITFLNVVEYIKKRDNAKCYLMLRDIFPQNAVDIGMMSKSGIKGVAYRYFRNKEKKLYEVSDHIGCMSQGNVEYLLKHNPEIDAKKVPYLQEHIDQKKAIYERYKEGLKDLPVKMNPYDAEKSIPNFWLSCLLIDEDAMCKQVRDDQKAFYISAEGKSCPTEILETLARFNAEGRPIWKPMHEQPIYRSHAFVTTSGNGRGQSNAYIDSGKVKDVGMDIFRRGLCLPSDNKMTEEQQNVIIEIIHRCFR